MYLYCKSWDLEINPTKTKTTIFANKKLQQNPVFTHNEDKARKALFAVLRKSRKLLLSIDIQLQLFDSVVSPIFLYASKMSGFEKLLYQILQGNK